MGKEGAAVGRAGTKMKFAHVGPVKSVDTLTHISKAIQNRL